MPSQDSGICGTVRDEENMKTASKRLKHWHRRKACAQLAEPGLRNRLDLMENPSPLKPSKTELDNWWMLPPSQVTGCVKER